MKQEVLREMMLKKAGGCNVPHNLYSPPNIIRVMKSIRTRQARQRVNIRT